MHRLITFIILIPLVTSAHIQKNPSKAVLSKTYAQAIADFIKAANKKSNAHFDTLFFGKHVNGQPDDFPDIELPKMRENVQIRLITSEEVAKFQKERKSRIYINLMGWVDSNGAEFIFVVFSNGFVHQYDYFLNYTYSSKRKEYELVKFKIKTPN